ncbi:MAG: hypothetical protein WCI73_03830 [Phycisphaerae bacterium]
MGRSKTRGKLVDELTTEELRSEHQRGRKMIPFLRGVAVKGLQKRLHAIERRLELMSQSKARD